MVLAHPGCECKTCRDAELFGMKMMHEMMAVRA